MKQFSNYDKAKENAKFSAMEKLPAGAYVCKILAVKYETAEQEGYSDRIRLQFDIEEGEFKGFFKKQYDANTNEDKKFKGQHAIWVPKEDGSEHDQWTANTFAKWTTAFEDSNPGYIWDWQEDKWKGKIVGIVFGQTGNVIEGKEITYTEPRFACDAKLVREGKAPTAKFLKKNGYGDGPNTAATSDDFVNVADSEESEIPFD